MPSGRQQLSFAIKAINEAKAELDHVSGGIDKVEASAAKANSGGLGKFGGILGDIGKTAAAVVLGQGIIKAPGFFLDAAKAAAEDEAATARLTKAVLNTGYAYEDAADYFADGIATGQKLAFTDDQIRDSLVTLIGATGNLDEAERRQTAAMDLSRGAGIDLAMASKMLGKINGENVEVFKRLGITLGDNATEADALAAVQQKFGGQAETYAKSTAGQFEQFKIRLGEVKEQIGYALLPIMTKVGDVMVKYVAPALEKAAGWVSKFIEAGLDKITGFVKDVAGPAQRVAEALKSWAENDAIPAIQAFGETLRDTVIPAITEFATTLKDKLQGPLEAVVGFLGGKDEIFKALGIAIGIVTGAVVAWSVAQAVLNVVMAANPMGLILIAITLLVAGIVLLIRHWDDIVAKFPALGVAVDAIKTGLLAFVDWIKGPFVDGVGAVVTAISTALGAAITWVQNNWGKLKDPIQGVWDAVQLIFTAAFTQIRIVLETFFDIIHGLIDVFVGVFTGDWGRAKDGVLLIFTALKDGAIESVNNMISLVTGLAPLVLNAGAAIGKALVDGLKGALDALVSVGANALSAGLDIARTIGNAIIGVINGILNKFNRAVEFTIGMPGPIPDIEIDPPDIPGIPLMAKGGIVTRPTLAIIGEAGPEAVVPLSGGHGFGEINIYIGPGAYIQDIGAFAADLRRELGRSFAA